MPILKPGILIPLSPEGQLVPASVTSASGVDEKIANLSITLSFANAELVEEGRDYAPDFLERHTYVCFQPEGQGSFATGCYPIYPSQTGDPGAGTGVDEGFRDDAAAILRGIFAAATLHRTREGGSELALGASEGAPDPSSRLLDRRSRSQLGGAGCQGLPEDPVRFHGRQDVRNGLS